MKTAKEWARIRWVTKLTSEDIQLDVINTVLDGVEKLESQSASWTRLINGDDVVKLCERLKKEVES